MRIGHRKRRISAKLTSPSDDVLLKDVKDWALLPFSPHYVTEDNSTIMATMYGSPDPGGANAANSSACPGGEQVIATNEFDFGPAFNIGPGRYAAPGSVSNGESARKASTDRRRLSSWCHIGMKVYHKNSPENIGVITAMNGAWITCRFCHTSSNKKIKSFRVSELRAAHGLTDLTNEQQIDAIGQQQKRLKMLDSSSEDDAILLSRVESAAENGVDDFMATVTSAVTDTSFQFTSGSEIDLKSEIHTYEDNKTARAVKSLENWCNTPQSFSTPYTVPPTSPLKLLAHIQNSGIGDFGRMSSLEIASPQASKFSSGDDIFGPSDDLAFMDSFLAEDGEGLLNFDDTKLHSEVLNVSSGDENRNFRLIESLCQLPMPPTKDTSSPTSAPDFNDQV